MRTARRAWPVRGADFQNGGYPLTSPGNQPIQGILGVKRVDSFSLFDGATDGQVLLSNQIGPTIKGSNTDASIDDTGFTYLGVNTASEVVPWNFVNKRRLRDFTHLQMVKSIRLRLARENVTPHDVQNVLNDMEVVLTQLKIVGGTIGFKVEFVAANNTTTGLRAGAFTVDFQSEEPAPIMLITINSALDDQALVDELATLAAETASTVATAS